MRRDFVFGPSIHSRGHERVLSNTASSRVVRSQQWCARTARSAPDFVATGIGIRRLHRHETGPSRRWESDDRSIAAPPHAPSRTREPGVSCREAVITASRQDELQQLGRAESSGANVWGSVVGPGRGSGLRGGTTPAQGRACRRSGGPGLGGIGIGVGIEDYAFEGAAGRDGPIRRWTEAGRCPSPQSARQLSLGAPSAHRVGRPSSMQVTAGSKNWRLHRTHKSEVSSRTRHIGFTECLRSYQRVNADSTNDTASNRLRTGGQRLRPHTVAPPRLYVPLFPIFVLKRKILMFAMFVFVRGVCVCWWHRRTPVRCIAVKVPPVRRILPPEGPGTSNPKGRSGGTR